MVKVIKILEKILTAVERGFDNLPSILKIWVLLPVVVIYALSFIGFIGFIAGELEYSNIGATVLMSPVIYSLSIFIINTVKYYVGDSDGK